MRAPTAPDYIYVKTALFDKFVPKRSSFIKSGTTKNLDLKAKSVDRISWSSSRCALKTGVSYLLKRHTPQMTAQIVLPPTLKELEPGGGIILEDYIRLK